MRAGKLSLLFAPSTVALAACGGPSDVPRPSGERMSATPSDQCALGASYPDSELITSFDTSNGFTQCGAPPALQCAFYQNEDTAHAPEDQFGNKGSDCVEEIDRNGQFVSSGVVETLSRLPEQTERCGTATTALHWVGSNVSQCEGTNGRNGWGSSYEIDFETNGMKGPIDASAWDGVSFWLKKGSGPTQGALILLVVDSLGAGMPVVDPDTGAELSCSVADPPTNLPLPAPDANKCDPYSAGVTITADWSFVPIRFADLTQKGFGVVGPFDLTHLVRLQFLLDAGDEDFWIDDISFFREPVP